MGTNQKEISAEMKQYQADRESERSKENKASQPEAGMIYPGGISEDMKRYLEDRRKEKSNGK